MNDIADIKSTLVFNTLSIRYIFTLSLSAISVVTYYKNYIYSFPLHSIAQKTTLVILTDASGLDLLRIVRFPPGFAADKVDYLYLQ